MCIHVYVVYAFSMCMCMLMCMCVLHMLMFICVYVQNVCICVYVNVISVYIQCIYTFINMHICKIPGVHVYIYMLILCVHEVISCVCTIPCVYVNILCMHVSIYVLPTWCTGRLLCVCTCVCPLALLPRRGYCHLSAAEAWFRERSHGASHTVSFLILHGPAGGILFITPNLKATKILGLTSIVPHCPLVRQHGV